MLQFATINNSSSRWGLSFYAFLDLMRRNWSQSWQRRKSVWRAPSWISRELDQPPPIRTCAWGRFRSFPFLLLWKVYLKYNCAHSPLPQILSIQFVSSRTHILRWSHRLHHYSPSPNLNHLLVHMRFAGTSPMLLLQSFDFLLRNKIVFLLSPLIRVSVTGGLLHFGYFAVQFFQFEVEIRMASFLFSELDGMQYLLKPQRIVSLSLSNLSYRYFSDDLLEEFHSKLFANLWFSFLLWSLSFAWSLSSRTWLRHKINN